MIFLALLCLFSLAITVFFVAAMWKVFSKAGQPGWAILIPIYNTYIMCKVAGRPGWWVLLCFIPIVNVVIALMLALDIAKNFGQGTGFGLGLFFLGFIFYPILAFGNATYIAGAAPPPPPVPTPQPVA